MITNLCTCGKSHICDINLIDISENSSEKAYEYIKQEKYKHICIVFDINTKFFYFDELKKLFTENKIDFTVCLFEDENLVPDEKALDYLNQMSEGYDFLLAIGSGTINDLTRYASFKKSINYGILATAPSMDGYASTVSPLIVNGLKITFPALNAKFILGDISVLSNAPKKMLQAGIGDLVGKYSCITDWKASNLLFNEYYCDKVADMTINSVKRIKNSTDNSDLIKKVTDSLILSGVAMSYVGNSRPASGAEHHISHFWEMMFLFEGKPPVLHGIKVGVAALAIEKFYCFLIEEKIHWEKAIINAPSRNNYAEEMQSVFGQASREIINEEEKLQRYEKSCVISRLNSYQKNWDNYIEMLKNTLNECKIKETLLKYGHPTSPEDIGIDKELYVKGIIFAKEVRPRFTILQVLFDLGLLEKYALKSAEEFW